MAFDYKEFGIVVCGEEDYEDVDEKEEVDS